MARHKARRRDLTDADLQILALAAELERDGQCADLVQLIRTETTRGPVTVADILRLRRVVRRREAGHADPGFEAWAVGMLRGRFNEPAAVSWWYRSDVAGL